MVTRCCLGVQGVEGRQVVAVADLTSTPDLAAFLMLRRQSWFIPASTDVSSRSSPANGIWKTYCG